jgi:hypothetical protein
MSNIVYTPPSAHDPNLIMAINDKCEYLGWVDKTSPAVYKQVFVSPPNEDEWRYDEVRHCWYRVWPVDKDGNITTVNHAVDLVDVPPPAGNMKWNSEISQWEDIIPIERQKIEYRREAARMVDFILRMECDSDEDFHNEVVLMRKHLEQYWAERGKINTSKASKQCALYLESLNDEANIISDDLKAARIQFLVNIKDIEKI